MPVSDSQLYFKAISTFILPVTSAYCLSSTLQTLSPFDALFDQKTNPSIHQYIADPSFTLFSTILFLPLLCGYITGRNSVYSALRWLGCTYILSGGFFVSALITSNIWLSIACLMLSGFSLNLACMVSYTFICEYMFRTKNYIDNFTKTIGACFVLGVGMCAVLSFIDLKDEIALMSISEVLLILSIFPCFFLTEKPLLLKALSEQLPISTSSSIILRKSIIFHGESFSENSENEALFLSEDRNMPKHISEGSIKPLKLTGAKGFAIIMTLGALIGILSIIRQEKQLNSILEDWTFHASSIQCVLFGLSGLFIARGKWQKKTLEKGIIGAVIAYVIVSVFQLSEVQTIPVFIIQSLAAGSALVMCLLYIPYLVGFKIKLMSKIFGLFAWFVNLVQLLVKSSEASLWFDVITIGCVMLLCLVFMGVTMKDWSVKEGKRSLIAQINM